MGQDEYKETASLGMLRKAYTILRQFPEDTELSGLVFETQTMMLLTTRAAMEQFANDHGLLVTVTYSEEKDLPYYRWVTYVMCYDGLFIKSCFLERKEAEDDA